MTMETVLLICGAWWAVGIASCLWACWVSDDDVYTVGDILKIFVVSLSGPIGTIVIASYLISNAQLMDRVVWQRKKP